MKSSPFWQRPEEWPMNLDWKIHWAPGKFPSIVFMLIFVEYSPEWWCDEAQVPTALWGFFTIYTHTHTILGPDKRVCTHAKHLANVSKFHPTTHVILWRQHCCDYSHLTEDEEPESQKGSLLAWFHVGNRVRGKLELELRWPDPQPTECRSGLVHYCAQHQQIPREDVSS